MPTEVGSVFTRLGFRADDSEATRYERRVDSVRAKTRAPIVQRVELDADDRAIGRFEQRVQAVRNRTRTPIVQHVDIDAGGVGEYTQNVSQANRTTGQFSQTLGGLARSARGAGGAIGGGGGLTAHVGGLGGKLGPVLGLLAALIPIMVAVGGAAVALGSSLAAAAAGAAAVGVGIAAATGPLAALAGAVVQRVGLISDAYGALSAQQEKSGATGRAAASAQASAARAIQTAQQALDDARRDGAERVAAAEQALEDAQRTRGRTLADAERQLQEARVDGARRIADAERNLAAARASATTEIRSAERDLAKARISGQESVRAAEGNLATALGAARAARDALTDAESRARRERQDLARSARQAQLDEESASIALARAQQRLAELTGRPHTALDVREAQQAVRIAQQGVQDAAAARRRADEDAAAGTNTVKLARDHLADANRRVAQAEREIHVARAEATAERQRAENELRRTTTEAARDRRAAEEAVAAATIAAAAATADARRALARDTADSQRAVARAHEDVAAAARDASRQTARAAAAVATARTAAADATSAQGAAADAAEAKLAKLSDTERRLLTRARSFAQSWRETFAPATDAIFDGVARAMGRIEPLMVRYKGRLAAIGDEIGDLIDRGARSLAGPEWTAALDEFVATAHRVTRPLAEAMGSGLEALRDIAVAAQPYVIEFAEYLRDAFARLADATGDSERLDDVIGDLVDSTKDWWNLLVAVADLLITVFGGGKREGDNLVETMTKIVKRWDAFLETDEGQQQMKDFFRDAVTTTKDLASVLGDLVSVIFTVSRWFLKLGDTWNQVEIEMQRGSLAVAMTIRDIFVWSIDEIIGALTSLLGGFSTVASALGRLPGGGKFKAIAGAIDGARDSMDGFRKSLREGNDEMGRQQTIKLLQREVTVLRERLTHLDKGTKDYRETAEKLRGKQRQLNAAMGDADSAGKRGARGPKALGSSARNALVVIDDANAKIVGSYNQLAGQLGDLKPLKFRASRALRELVDEPSSISSTPPVPGLDRATGGWIGQPGQAGPDTIRRDAPIGAAVLNRHQLPAAAAAMAAHGLDVDALAGGPQSGPTRPVNVGSGEFMVAPDRVGLLDRALGAIGLGGLDDLFSRIRTPHWMAAGGIVPIPWAPGEEIAASALARATAYHRRFGVGVSDAFDRDRSGKHRSAGHNVTGTAVDFVGTPAQTDALVRQAVADGYTVYYDGRFGSTNLPPHGPGHHAHVEFGGKGGNVPGGGVAGLLERIGTPKITGPAGRLRSIAQRIAQRITGAANAQLGTTAGAAGAGGSPGSNRQIRSWLYQGLKLAGLPPTPANINTLYGRVMQESGGNPRAINLWDSNAKKGTPSKGLLQTIGSTFARFKVRGHNDIFNPVDNVAAAVRYMIATYGRLVGRGSGGYARGGIVGALQRLASGGFVGGRRTGSVGQASATPSFAGGGFIGSKAYGNLRKLQGTRIAAYDHAQDRVEQLQSDYSYRDREFNLSDEELIDPETGAVNTDAVAKRAGELAKLIEIREAIYKKLNDMRQIVERIQTTYRTLIKRLQAAMKSISRNTKGGRERRAKYASAIDRYRGELGEWGEKSGELFDAWRDAGLDVREVRNERADVLGTQGTSPADSSDSSTDATDPGTAATDVPAGPSPQEVAAAAREMFAAFTAERERVFSSFGGNTVARGQAPFASPLQQAAGAQYFGGAGNPKAYAAAGGRVTLIENAEFRSDFGGPPPSGETYVQQQAREVALAFE